MPACPTADTLERFLLGQCGPDESAFLSVHLDACDRCRTWIDQARKDDALLTRLRASSHSRAPVPRTPAGPAIPGYEIRKEIHRGGQGAVFEAVQQSTHQLVALKVMHGAGSENARTRFEREVDLLGRLRHPGIVRVFDGGVSGDRAWFAMEFVRGRALGEVVGNLPLRDALRLFVKICDAVNAAHLQGVIHRDLKPGNILIDDRAEPRIVDFGLARIATEGGTASAVTLTGQFMGSLPWASPEQVAGAAHVVDLRSDIYSLGVVLFQLLTGAFPYDVTGGFAKVARTIEHAEPRRPSAARPGLDADIDTIVLRCLAKEPGRRYQSASALSTDLERYLAGQPIEARRDSAWYLMGRAMRRYRAMAAAAAVVALVLGILGGMLWRTNARLDTALLVAEQRRVEAESSAATANQVVAFLRQTLGSVDASLAQGRDTAIVEEMLASAEVRIADSLEDQPLARARLRNAIGWAYERLGKPDRAVEHLREAHRLYDALDRESSVEAVDNALDLAMALAGLGRAGDAHEAADEARRRAEAAFGETHASAIAAIQLSGRMLEFLGRADEALPFLERGDRLAAAHLPESGELVWRGRLYHGSALLRLGRFDEAETVLREALDLARRHLGERHSDTHVVIGYLAGVMLESGRPAQAVPLLEESFVFRRELHGPEHARTIGMQTILAGALMESGELQRAEPLFDDVLRVRRRDLPPAHPLLAMALANAARVRMYGERFTEALPLYEEALLVARTGLPAGHPDIHAREIDLGYCLVGTGQEVRGMEALRDVYDRCAARLGAGDRMTRRAATTLADACERVGDADRAASWRKAAAEGRPPAHAGGGGDE